MKDYLKESIECLQSLYKDEQVRLYMDCMLRIITKTYELGHTIYLCGAGGSLHDHAASEFMNRFTTRREFPISAVDLSGNTCLISAISNDYGYEYIFSKQIEALGKEGDLLIGISTSGKTQAVINAVRVASALRLNTIFVTGQMKEVPWAYLHLRLPSNQTGHIQEMWLSVLHAICDKIDRQVVAGVFPE